MSLPIFPKKESDEAAFVPEREDRDLTLFLCGPSKCEHDYQGMEEVRESGESRGWTAVCTKCGARAIDEAAWS